MVGDNAQANVVFLVGTVGDACKFCSAVKNGTNLIDFIEVLNTLLEESNTFKAHTGIDVLVGQFAQDFELGLTGSFSTQVLHEHEVPDFDVAIFICYWATLDAVRRATIEVNFRTRACRTRLTGRPVVVFLATTLNTLIRKTSGLLPEGNGLIIVFVDSDPEILLSKPKTAISLRRCQKFPGIFNGLFLEVVTK